MIRSAASEKIADINSLKIDSKFSKPDAKIIDIKGKNHYQARSASIRQISSSSSQAAIPLFYNLIYKMTITGTYLTFFTIISIGTRYPAATTHMNMDSTSTVSSVVAG